MPKHTKKHKPLFVLLSKEEHKQLIEAQQKAQFRSLSEYVRRVLFHGHPINEINVV